MTDPHLATDISGLGVLLIIIATLAGLVVQVWRYRQSRRRACYQSAAVDDELVREAKINARLARGFRPARAEAIAREVHSVDVSITVTVQ